MKCSPTMRAGAGIHPVLTGVFAIVLTSPFALHAARPDIPQIQRQAEKGSIRHEIELGADYFIGRGVPQDEKQAAYWYERAAQSGDPAAQDQIGYFYQVGIGVPRDPAQAVRWYQRSVAGGYVPAKDNLAVAYLWGIGGRQDTDLALQLLRQAFSQGDGLAACYIGDMYWSGVGVPRDKAEAMRWYEAGSKLHDPRAELNLGLLLVQSKNPDSLKRAERLLRSSEQSGLVLAKHELGLLLVRKPELARNPDEGVGLLKQAAEAGSWRSSTVLGILARDGRGMPADAKSAYYRFRVASLQGGDEATNMLAKDFRDLRDKLPEADREALESEAVAWFQGHHLSLQFVFKGGENWKQFPAMALENADRQIHGGRLIATELTSTQAISD